MNQEKEKELQILTHIQGNETPLRQRDLAELADISLGMTNVILKRLAEKGWLKMQHINSRKVKYAVTPEGASEIARRSKQLLKRTLKDIGRYRDAVDAFVRESKAQGCTAIRLVNPTEADFMVEWACSRHGMVLYRGSREEQPSGAIAEEVILDAGEVLAHN